MRQCEFKRKYNPLNGRYEKKHIYGEGIFDSITIFLFNETTKKIAKEASKKAAAAVLNKTGTYVGNKAGDKIIKLLQKKETPIQSISNKIKRDSMSNKQDSNLTDYEINERIQRLLSGSGKIKRLKI